MSMMENNDSIEYHSMEIEEGEEFTKNDSAILNEIDMKLDQEISEDLAAPPVTFLAAYQ